MDTQITSNWMDRYIDGDLSESERQLFQLNLRRNSLLRKELLLDAQLNRFMEDTETIELMRKIRKITDKPGLVNRKYTIAMIAASVFCLIVFGASYLLLRQDPSDSLLVYQKNMVQENYIPDGPRSVVQKIRDVRKIPKVSLGYSQKLALRPGMDDNFTPMVEYEPLVGAVTRSSGIVVISPEPEVKTYLNHAVPFEWGGLIASDSVNIVIVNNKGTSVLSSSLSAQSRKYLLETGKTGRGLFYWKVLVNDEIIMMGRIIVE